MDSIVTLNRRRSARYALPLQCWVKARDWQEAVKFDVSEISLHGIWIQTDLMLDEGELLVVSLDVGTASFRHLLAQVRHVRIQRRQAETRASGMAIDFLDIRPSERDALQIALDQRATALQIEPIAA